MKNIKKMLLLVLAVVSVLSVIALGGCVDKPAVQEVTELMLPTLDKNQIAVIVKNGDKDYTNIVVTLGPTGTDAQNAEGVLQYLADLGLLTVSMSGDSSSQFGKSLDKLNDIVYDVAAHTYIACYTSVLGEGGGASVAYTIGGVKLYYSNYGVSQMTVAAGTVLYFEGGSW